MSGDTPPFSRPVPSAFRDGLPSTAKALSKGQQAPKDRKRLSKCIRPARTADGALRPCRQCDACAYAVQSEKVRLLGREIDPTLPSFFVTATYSDEQAMEDLLAPAKLEGELTPAQTKVISRWEAKIADLDALADSCGHEQERRAASLRARRAYRQKKLDEFIQAAVAPRPPRLLINRKAGKLWQERIKHRLAQLDPPQPPPRMVLKHEYGSHTHRPHIHAMVITPTPAQLLACIETWGRLWAPKKVRQAWKKGLSLPPFRNWEPVASAPLGRGHIQVQPVTDDKIAAYVSKDLYRGQDAQAFEYIAKALEPPCIVWPRNPGMGCGGWREFLDTRWREQLQRQVFQPVDVELSIQDTRRKSTSLRHRLAHVSWDRSPGANGQARKHYHRCPESVWRRFTQEVITPWRESDPAHFEARDLVHQALREEDRAEADGLGYAQEQEHQALVAARRRLENWKRLRHRKGLGLPTYAERSEEYVRRRMAELRGGQIAALAIPGPKGR